jgi:SAM-dependent methyltransferase
MRVKCVRWIGSLRMVPRTRVVAPMGASLIADDLWASAHSIGRQLGIAPDRFDLVSWWYRHQMAVSLARLVDGLAPSASPRTVLDLSCGKGLVVGALNNDHVRVVGIDVPFPESDQLHVEGSYWQTSFWHAASSVQSTRSAVRAMGSQRGVRFAYYGTTAIPFQSESLDGIVAYAVYEHIEPVNRHAWLREVARCLRPGGVLLVACCPRPEAVTERLARRLGFPCHEYLIGSSDLLEDVGSADLRVEEWWLSHNLPCFLPGAPLSLARAYLAAQEGFASGIDDAVGRWTGSRWAHHTNLIARKPGRE